MNNTFNTSLNQVPALIKEYGEHYMDGATILNYGCGKGYKKVEEYFNGSTVINYDKYSNEAHIRELDRSKEYNPIFCANVLNVIETEEEMNEMLEDIRNLCVEDYGAYFSVYEGNGTGVGNPTSKGYQRNQKAKEYMNILSRHFDMVSRDGNNFICTVVRK